MKNRLFFIFLLFEITFSFAFQNSHHTKISVTWDPDRSVLSGTMSVTYFNHSPDTLIDLYFLLLYNIQNPNSQSVERLLVENGDVKWKIDGPLLRIMPENPVPPGDSINVCMDFSSVVPEIGDRWGVIGDQVILGAWYPQIAVYDQRGWNVLTSADGEFYQEFGDFEIDITLPDSVILSGTGDIQWIYTDSMNHKKHYRISAHHVQDVLLAWDKTYVMKKVSDTPVPVELIYSDYLENSWGKLDDVIRFTLNWLEEHIGPFPYESLKVISGFVHAGGIEYPGAVVINASIIEKTELKRTIIHEIAHQYFFGGMATNQTLYGWMDEGFATFIEGEIARELGLQSIYEMPWPPQFLYSSRPLPDSIPYNAIWLNGMYHSFDLDAPSNWVMDWYPEDPYFFHYERIELILFQLKNYLGKDRFYRVLKSYYHHLVNTHPYPDDFFKILDRAAGEMLSNSVRSLINNPYNVDIAIEKVDVQTKKPGLHHVAITFKRHTPNVIPFKFKVKTKTGDTVFTIPVSVVSSEKDNILSPWFVHQKQYRCEIELSEVPVEISILRNTNVMDINWANDFWKNNHPFIFFRNDASRYILPGWIQGEAQPRILFDNSNKWIPGIRYRFLKIPLWDYEGRFSVGTWSRKLYYQQAINRTYFNRINLSADIGISVISDFIYREWRIYQNLYLRNQKRIIAMEVGLGNHQVADPNMFIPVNRNTGINILDGFLMVKRLHSYRADEDFIRFHLQTVLLPGQKTLPTISMSILKNKTFEYTWFTDLGIHLVYQHPNQSAINTINPGGVWITDYLTDPFHRYPGIIPVQWFRKGHQGLSSEIGYIDSGSYYRFTVGLWQTFRITHDNLNYFVRSKLLFNKIDFTWSLWFQNRLLSRSIESASIAHLESTIGHTISLNWLNKFRWIPEIRIHFPIVKQKNQQWFSVTNSWLVELRGAL